MSAPVIYDASTIVRSMRAEGKPVTGDALLGLWHRATADGVIARVFDTRDPEMTPITGEIPDIDAVAIAEWTCPGGLW